MKSLLVGLLALGSLSAFAGDYCALTRMSTGEILFETTDDLQSEAISVFISSDKKSIEVQTENNTMNVYKKGSIIAHLSKYESNFGLSFGVVTKDLEYQNNSPEIKVLVSAYDAKSLSLNEYDLGMVCASY